MGALDDSGPVLYCWNLVPYLDVGLESAGIERCGEAERPLERQQERRPDDEGHWWISSVSTAQRTRKWEENFGPTRVKFTPIKVVLRRTRAVTSNGQKSRLHE